MKKLEKTDGHGNSSTTNFMLDDVIESFDKKGINNGDNDGLIIELTIQKIEYGRKCIFQVIAKGGNWPKLDEELKSQILKLGGKPQNIQII